MQVTSAHARVERQNRQRTALIIGFAVLLGLLSAALYLMPWSSRDLDVGFTDEARRNPFLAAETFLNQFDVTVNAENGLALLDELPPTSDVLLIASSRRSLSERRVNALIDWVDAGGGLIVVASDLYDEDREDKGDRLLDYFGVWLYEGEATGAADAQTETSAGDAEDPTEADVDDAEADAEDSQSRTFADVLLAANRPADNCQNRAGLTPVNIDGEERELFARLSAQHHLWFEESQDYAYAANDIGAQLVYIEYGAGTLHVLTSLRQWRNRQIGCFDHAHLLRSLTEEIDTLWLLFNTDIEPLHLIIWNKWRVAVCLAFAWLLFWLWRSAYRSTRIEPEEPRERREVMEHIAGMSRFLYQQKEPALLLSGLRADCYRGDPAEPGEQQRLAATIAGWADQLNIDEARIRWALTADIARDSKELTNAVALLQKIRAVAKQ